MRKRYGARSARIEGGVWTSEKHGSVSLAARGLWAMMLSYCADRMTDGLVPRRFIPALGEGADDALSELVEAKLVHLHETTAELHDYLRHNISSAEWKKQKGTDASRKKKARAASSKDAKRSLERVPLCDVPPSSETPEDEAVSVDCVESLSDSRDLEEERVQGMSDRTSDGTPTGVSTSTSKRVKRKRKKEPPDPGTPIGRWRLFEDAWRDAFGGGGLGLYDAKRGDQSMRLDVDWLPEVVAMIATLRAGDGWMPSDPWAFFVKHAGNWPARLRATKAKAASATPARRQASNADTAKHFRAMGLHEVADAMEAANA